MDKLPLCRRTCLIKIIAEFSNLANIILTVMAIIFAIVIVGKLNTENMLCQTADDRTYS